MRRFILAAVRYTRRGESEVWCSRQCCGDGEQHAIRKGGRPKKYKTDAERQRAEREQGTAVQTVGRGRNPVRAEREDEDNRGEWIGVRT